MFRIACLFTLLLPLGGCTDIALSYRAWKNERQNNQHDRAYRKAVSQQAYDQQLSGTWTRHRLGGGKAILTTTETLSLFSDGAFVLRTATGRVFWPSIRTSAGTWASRGDGRVELTFEETSETREIALSGWTSVLREAERRVMGSPRERYLSSVIFGDDGLPIVVLHQIAEADADFDEQYQSFAGAYLPDADTVLQADRALIERLKREKPGRSYLRQYGGFQTAYLIGERQRFLRIQLTAADAFEDDPSPTGFGWGGLLQGFHEVWDGGDDYGQALYNVETGKIVSLMFNGDV